MSLMSNLGLIYFLAPFLNIVQNKISLVFTIIFGFEEINLVLKNGLKIKLKKSQFDILQSIMGIVAYSMTSKFKDGQFLNLSFDGKNFFDIDTKNLDFETENLVLLLYFGTKYGADFINSDKNGMEGKRDKTFHIYDSEGKKIVETPNGIKFFMDSIHPGNTIVETFVNKIHFINSDINWNGKIVIDVGAECGDTPLYYASLGATVYAFEPIKEHYDAMIRNLSLNPDIAKNVIPINAAIGKDEILTFYHSGSSDIGVSASFVYNLHGKNAKTTEVKGYSVESAIEEFKINRVDLLKMDCKGCQFFLTKDSLKMVDMVKIEYGIRERNHKIDDLLELLKASDFDCVIYRTNPFHRVSNKIGGNIFGKKNSK
tara:strand:- start:19381 stop:20493 length:1113 start_codon:yes stop_codon:yes gene_type:complete